ncbi:unnamed protein product [Adineta ricciae]|uniref:Uncharacterized protein n=1 Tax=Adineta ricciae TaxID=249248 RepID=A0A815VRP3_ADIRI|nr:unnamed protein product [Adineta ricciae]
MTPYVFYVIHFLQYILLSYKIRSFPRLFQHITSFGRCWHTKKFDVVLNYYAENPGLVARYITHLKSLKTFKNIDLHIIVYTKNPRTNKTLLKEILKVNNIIELPNIGREGATYLHHIIENYDTVADHTLFTQAAMAGTTITGLSGWFIDRLENQFNSSVGYMPLVSNNMISNYNCGFHQSGHYPRLTEMWGILEKTICPPGGQAVSRNTYKYHQLILKMIVMSAVMSNLKVELKYSTIRSTIQVSTYSRIPLYQ